jgi:pimeloyl-ACP methyl ester carboxylesterase
VVGEAIRTRELIVLDGLDVIVRGTYHKIRDDSSGAQSSLIDRARVGVLFLNGLNATRAANGDAAVYWADSLAARGYPSFRLDLPGYGDSDEDPPEDWLAFINRGGYASIVSGKIIELVARFNLSGVVIAGHCAGAVSAIYAAAVSKECRGLVLMDPYYHLPQTTRPKFRQRLNLWALQSDLGRSLDRVYRHAKEIPLFFRRKVPAENANFPLLRRWKELTSTGLPILILKAPTRKVPNIKPKVGEFDYLDYVLRLAGRRSRVVVRVMDGANHSFANRLGREAVRVHTEEWLDACFPPTGREESVVSTLRPETDNLDNVRESREQYLKV